MYNNGNSSKNVTGSSVVDGSLENADYADNAISGDKVDGGIISNFQSTGIDDRLPTGKILTLSTTGIEVAGGITTDGITETSSGKVGIGRSVPSVTLDVQGTGVNLRNPSYYSGTYSLNLNQDSATGDFKVKYYGNERFRVRANGGITFNGDTAAANALDDYEEGTFSGTTLGSTYSGVYTKIGDTVSVRVECTIAGGNYGVAVLPFTPSEFIGVLPFSNSTSSNTDFVQTYLATTGMYLYSRAGAQIVSIPAGTIRFMLTYKT